MVWTNVALINTKEGWQYTQPFVGDYVRIRHLLGVAQDDLPYGFTGLLAQAFDFENTVELYNIRKLYPFNQEDIFSVINPFPDQSRRLGIRGQKRYQTKINWRVVIDVWSGSELPDLNSINQSLDIEQQIADLSQEFSTQINQSDAGIYSLAQGISQLLPNTQARQLRQRTRRRLDLNNNFL